MGLFRSLFKKRAQRKAELKVAKARARAEVKTSAKMKKRLHKRLAREEKNLLKMEQKTLKKRDKHHEKMAKLKLDQLKEGRFNAKKVLRYATALRALAPFALPVIYRGIVALRDKSSENRARQLGVKVEDLAEFSGHGAELRAKIAQVRKAAEQFKIPAGLQHDINERLDELNAAVHNAELMTPEPRSRAHRSIENDIDKVNKELLKNIV
ncbi:DUF6474 family protein [Corynebacterium sp. ES2794-CONJ1]|uniref:DUF6474 family protein n=1 Tax=unclassified Corynebacterium TaxID=2624378 RepID=UPI00216955F8|nr:MULTISPECIES: DUF6474 family protein [unclassified Corynebacterium]MCS4490082.1 DUF6474 family protein [Corynebacterium sp. ES2775-CONJ]MCS4492568.1 DUF6474 family protein [Corynebacterium sp. ES2715-CONJ3]MCS4532217.1 DUF6474 family protein [Corynebacterium sp. ES2730-CONJ]MCU9519613.1 DUF6474 family protein [Corynebacterium sp. ES2794-CONJ1]